MKCDFIPAQFKLGYRILMLMKRKKDGGTDNDRKSVRELSTCAEHWDEIWQKFQKIRKQDPLLRIYASVNHRNIEKSIREFKTRQLNVDYGHKNSKHEFYADVHNQFLSCLAKPSCKKTPYFLIDCDNQSDQFLAKSLIKPQSIVLQYPTRNGFHLITEPFNPSGFPVSIQKDGMLLVSE